MVRIQELFSSRGLRRLSQAKQSNELRWLRCKKAVLMRNVEAGNMWQVVFKSKCFSRHLIGWFYRCSTLWWFNIAMENDPFVDDFPMNNSINSGFSMAMLVITRPGIASLDHWSRPVWVLGPVARSLCSRAQRISSCQGGIRWGWYLPNAPENATENV